jgi:hypothetical protein
VFKEATGSVSIVYAEAEYVAIGLAI